MLSGFCFVGYVFLVMYLCYRVTVFFSITSPLSVCAPGPKNFTSNLIETNHLVTLIEMCLFTCGFFFFFTEKNLSIVKDEVELNVSSSQDFPVPCHIARQSSSESKFQVTWIWQKETETKQRPIFVWHRNGTLQDRLGEGEQLRFSHPLPNQFSVTVLKPGPENSGLYFCEVEEWLPSLSHGWRMVAVDTSGHLTVNVHSEGKHNLM